MKFIFSSYSRCIVLHPPISIENFLPAAASFEILHAVEKRVLWSSLIPAGQLQTIHTVSLNDPLELSINLYYCRASQGVIIHQPKAQNQRKKYSVNPLQRTFESNKEETETENITTITLLDTTGQKLRLHIENILCGGGNRKITVYCPYWIINTSQFSFQIREEGEEELPAGTVTMTR